MKQEQLYNIAIYEQAILMTDHTSGTARQFIVQEEELMKLFKFDRSVTLRTFPGLIWMKASLEGNDRYLVTLKRKKRKIIYAHKQKFRHINIEIPNIAVIASIYQGNVNISQVFAYQGVLTNQSNLYELALPNIGGSSVCMGGERIPVVDDDILAAIEVALFETPFNHHQGLCGKDQVHLPEYVKKHRGKMPFRTLNFIGRGKNLLEAR